MEGGESKDSYCSLLHYSNCLKSCRFTTLTKNRFEYFIDADSWNYKRINFF